MKKKNILNFLYDRKSFLVKKKNILKILSDWTFCLLDLLSGFTKHWTFCLLYQVSDWTICLCTFCPLYQVSFGPSVCLDLLSLYQASCTKCLWTKCLWTNCPGTHFVSCPAGPCYIPSPLNPATPGEILNTYFLEHISFTLAYFHFAT